MKRKKGLIFFFVMIECEFGRGKICCVYYYEKNVQKYSEYSERFRELELLEYSEDSERFREYTE